MCKPVKQRNKHHVQDGRPMAKKSLAATKQREVDNNHFLHLCHAYGSTVACAQYVTAGEQYTFRVESVNTSKDSVDTNSHRVQSFPRFIIKCSEFTAANLINLLN